MQSSFLRRSAEGFALAGLILLTGCAQKAELTPNRWSTHLAGVERANISQDPVKLPVSVAWSKDVSDFSILRPHPKGQMSSPLIYDGVLYVGSTDSTLSAVDLSTGRVKWDFDAGYPIEATASVGEGMVCFGSLDGVLRCLDTADGRLLWQFQAKSEILSAPVITGSTVYFSSSDDRVYALSVKNGEKKWVYNRTTFQSVSPRIYGSAAYHNGRLYQFFSDGFVVAIEAENGRELWKRQAVKVFNSHENIRRTPLVANSMVYVIDDDRAVVALDPDTGEIKKSYQAVRTSDFIIQDKRTLIAAGTDRVVAYDMVSGTVLWERETEYKPLYSIFGAQNTVFLISNYIWKPLGMDWFSRERGRIEAISLKDGQVLWSRRLKSTISANGSTGQSRVSLLTDAGTLQVFGPED